MTEPFDDRDADLDAAERAMQRLGALSPEPGSADHAVAAALARVRPAELPPPSSSRTTPFRSLRTHVQLRRWLMPAGFAAAAAAVAFAFWVGVAPSTPASAAEVLREAIAKRAQFDGTIDVEQWDPQASRWVRLEQVQPALGRSLRWGEFHVDDVPRGTEPLAWTFIDSRLKYRAEYRPDLKAVYLADRFEWAESQAMPFDEQTLLDEAGLRDEWTSARSEAGGDTVLLFTHKPQPPAATQPTEEGSAPSNVPHRFRVTLEKSSGLLRSVELAMTPEATEFTPHLRYINRAGPQPELSWETLPVAPGTPRVDNRLTPEIRTWFATRDALYEQGIGFDTAVAVRHSIDPFGEKPLETGFVTIYAGKPQRWVQASWSVGHSARNPPGDRSNAAVPLPAGWPNPTFADVLKTVSATRPSQFAAFDGHTYWRIEMSGPTRVQTDVARARDRWLLTSLPSIIWPHSSTLLGGDMDNLFTQVKVEEVDRNKVVTITRFLRWSDTPDRLSRHEVMRFDFAPDPQSGPWVEFRQTMKFPQRGELPHEVWQWNYDVTSLVMYRDPVRVPTLWRRVVVDTSPSPSYPEVTRLIPAKSEAVPAEWFGDPRKVWGEPGGK
jgi:hypothetical protein